MEQTFQYTKLYNVTALLRNDEEATDEEEY